MICKDLFQIHFNRYTVSRCPNKSADVLSWTSLSRSHVHMNWLFSVTGVQKQHFWVVAYEQNITKLLLEQPSTPHSVHGEGLSLPTCSLTFTLWDGYWGGWNHFSFYFAFLGLLVKLSTFSRLLLSWFLPCALPFHILCPFFFHVIYYFSWTWSSSFYNLSSF